MKGGLKMKVRGTQKEKPKSVEVNVDTVYIRSDITSVENNDSGKQEWEYTEEQEDKDSFLGRVTKLSDLGQDVTDTELESMRQGQDISDMDIRLMALEEDK